METPVRWKLPLLITLLIHIVFSQGWLPGILPGVISDPPGPRRAIVITETKNIDPRLDDQLRMLQAGPIAQQLKSEGDTVVIVDQHAKDENDRPNAAVQDALTQLSKDGVTLPAIYVVNPATKRVTNKKSLYDGTRQSYLSAQEIAELIK